MVESKRLDVLLGRRVHTGQGEFEPLSPVTCKPASNLIDCGTAASIHLPLAPDYMITIFSHLQRIAAAPG